MVVWAEVGIEEGSCHVEVPEEWAVEDLLEETCSRGQETGSVQMRTYFSSGAVILNDSCIPFSL